MQNAKCIILLNYFARVSRPGVIELQRTIDGYFRRELDVNITSPFTTSLLVRQDSLREVV